MIKSNNTVNIEGTVIDHEQLNEYLSIDPNDKKTKYLVKPLLLISGAGLAMAAVFASIFLVAVSLVVIPLIGVAMWAMKPKQQRSQAAGQTEQTDVQAPAAAAAQTASTEAVEPAPVNNATNNGEPNPA